MPSGSVAASLIWGSGGRGSGSSQVHSLEPTPTGSRVPKSRIFKTVTLEYEKDSDEEDPLTSDVEDSVK